MNHTEQVIYLEPDDGLKPRTERANGQLEKPAPGVSASGPRLTADLKQKVKALVQLAREKGFLTREDIHQNLNGQSSAEDQEQIFRRLRDLEIEIMDETEGLPLERPIAYPEPVVAPRQPARLEELDDLLRIYLKQMALVPLLTGEQDRNISCLNS